MTIERYDRAFFIGIGGIGMSALARYFMQLGWEVAGYDKTQTSLTNSLIKEGVSVHFDDALKEIPSYYKNIEKTLVIYTPAVPQDSEELNYFKENQFDVLKRAQVVAAIANNGYCIAVAGTHGKTTTSSLIAHILKNSKKKVTAFLGGISTNYDTNLILGNGKEVVIEADEFDRSFLNLRPDLAVLTSMDADHLDIYGDAEEIEKNFKAFLALVRINGKKIVNADLDLDGITYSIEKVSDYKGVNIKIDNAQYSFSIQHNNRTTQKINSGLPGRHNVENAIAAAAACKEMGLTWEQIKNGIESFKGVKRRFEYQIKSDDLVYIDDYAHHPKEIKASLASIRELYPNKRITTIFQPHLFSRTRDFGIEFAEALKNTDELILMEIYPAREKPIPGIDSSWLLDKVELENKMLMEGKEILNHLASNRPEVLVTLGAGDIDKLIEPIIETLGNS